MEKEIICISLMIFLANVGHLGKVLRWGGSKTTFKALAQSSFYIL